MQLDGAAGHARDGGVPFDLAPAIVDEQAITPVIRSFTNKATGLGTRISVQNVSLRERSILAGIVIVCRCGAVDMHPK
jgi:hypothetical protein